MIARWLRDRPLPNRALPIKITVGVMYQDARPDGMPAQNEHQFLGDVEEALISDLAEHHAHLVLVVTSQGAREWVAYADSADWLNNWAPRFADTYLRPRPHDINAVLDHDWTTYRAFTA